jgi:uncharacterized membrane protein YvbJ
MAVKICKHCGEGNKETSHICVICSHSLKDAVTEGTPDSQKEYSSSLFRNKKGVTTCNHCNEKVEEGALKCKYCGSTITRAAQYSPSSYGSGNYSASSSPDGCAVALIFVATFFIPIAGLIVGGIFAFSDDPGKQDIGKALLIFGLIMIVLGIILVAILS